MVKKLILAVLTVGLLLPLAAAALWDLDAPVEFDGTGYIDTGVDIESWIHDDWTLRARVSFGGVLEDRRYMIWGYSRTPWDRTQMLHIASETDGRLRANVGGFDDARHMPGRGLFDGRERELVITQQGREWRVAVDGVLVHVGSVPELGPFDGGNTLTLGGAPTVSESWSGTIHAASLREGADESLTTEEVEAKRFTWIPPTEREDGEPLGANALAGYVLGCSMESGRYDGWVIEIPATPATHEEPVLTFEEGEHFCAMQARDTASRLSVWSNEVSFVIEADAVEPPVVEPPKPPTDVQAVRITIQITVEAGGGVQVEVTQ